MSEKIVDLPGRRGQAGEPIPDCPVMPLGHQNARYYLLSKGGEFLSFGFRELRTDAGLIALFDGDTTYLKAAFRRYGRGGEPLDDFNPKKAYEFLVARCAEAGLWDAETPVRGRGIWRVPGDKSERLLYHSGDQLLFADGERRLAGLKIGPAIYPRRPALPTPANEPCPAQAAREWHDGFRAWRYAPLGLGPDPGPDYLAADLLCGAVSLAMLGAAPPWRAHTLIHAVHGAGKSTLLEFIGAALGIAVVMNNFSEAGFRNSLANEARPVLVDEADSDEYGVMGQIVRVIRQMSGGEGVKGTRGEAAGGSRHFEIVGSAFLGCINMPPLAPQDLSRFLIVELLPSPAAAETMARRVIQRAGELSAALRARAFYGWPRFVANLAFVRSALFARGCNPRQADLLGALLSALAMMREERPIDADHADDLAEMAEPLIGAMAAESEDRSDARGCWIALLSRSVLSWRDGAAQTVGGLLLAACDPSGTDARQTLVNNCGIRVELGAATASRPEAPCIYVANQHAFLHETYRDTPWREGGWRHSLVRLDGAVPSAAPIRIGAVQQRAVAVPLKAARSRDGPEEKPANG